jgi:hypothetical protein
MARLGDNSIQGAVARYLLPRRCSLDGVGSMAIGVLDLPRIQSTAQTLMRTLI